MEGSDDPTALRIPSIHPCPVEATLYAGLVANLRPRAFLQLCPTQAGRRRASAGLLLRSGNGYVGIRVTAPRNVRFKHPTGYQLLRVSKEAPEHRYSVYTFAKGKSDRRCIQHSDSYQLQRLPRCSALLFTVTNIIWA